jgi:hypothetical protein
MLLFWIIKTYDMFVSERLFIYGMKMSYFMFIILRNEFHPFAILISAVDCSKLIYLLPCFK